MLVLRRYGIDKWVFETLMKDAPEELINPYATLGDLR
jgi:hypothetical protein